MKPTDTSTYKQIDQYIQGKNPGSMFNCDDFNLFGSYKNIRSSLVRLCKNRCLIRVFQGIYMKPAKEEPDIISIASEISRKNGSSIILVKDECIGGTRILTFHTDGSTRIITLSDGSVLKYIHKNPRTNEKENNKS